VLHVRPIIKGGAGQVKDIVVEVNQTALLVPGEYEVYPQIVHIPTPGGPIVVSLAHISYDQALQHFKVQINPKAELFKGQFSILVNLSDLVSK